MMLDDIVSRGRGGPPGQFHDNANGGQNGTVQEIMIPAGKAGLVIGKGGETIKQLQVCVGTGQSTSPHILQHSETASDRHLHCRSGLG